MIASSLPATLTRGAEGSVKRRRGFCAMRLSL